MLKQINKSLKKLKKEKTMNRCDKCEKLLFKIIQSGNSVLEIKCSRCGYIMEIDLQK